MTISKKYYVPLTAFLLCGLLSYSQNNYEILIPWNDTSVTGLYAEEMADSTVIILSNNSYFYPGPGILPAGPPVYGTGLIKLSPDGNITWKKLYNTNGSVFSINETGRVPASSFLNLQNSVLIPYSQYIGIVPCDSSASTIAAFTYKPGIVDVNPQSSSPTEQHLYLGDSLCSEITFQAFASINDSVMAAIENDERHDESYFVVRTVANTLISKYQIDTTYKMLNGTARWGSAFEEKVIYLSSDTSFLMIVYDNIAQSEKLVKINSWAEVTELFSTNVPLHYRFVGLEIFNGFFYGLYNELDTTVSYDKNLNTHLIRYFGDGTIQNEIILEHIKPIDFEITQQGKILLVSDKSQGDIYDSLPLPVRVFLLDTNLTAISYRDFGFPYIYLSDISYSSNGCFVVTGTWLKDVPDTNKQPNQVYCLKSHMDSINLPWTNIPPQAGTKEPFVKIYPNPSSGNFTLQTNFKSTAKLTVVNPLGQDIYHAIITTPKLEINLSSFPSGIYFLRLKSKEKIFSQKFIISR